MPRVHYSGGLSYLDGDDRVELLPGWPACAEGADPRLAQEPSTTVPAEATCEGCRVELARAGLAPARH